MLELYLLKKQKNLRKSQEVNLNNLSSKEVSERKQILEVLSSGIRNYRSNSLYK